MASGRDYLGNYRYVRLIRAGASCQVWEVAQDQTARRVALKVLQPEHSQNKEEVQHLKHEFEVGKMMKHPNVVEIYDYAVDRGIPYLVLELINGKNLKLVLRSGVEPLVPHLPQIVEQAAEGLNHVHEKGWVHRDVKPENIFLCDGEAYAGPDRRLKAGLAASQKSIKPGADFAPMNTLHRSARDGLANRTQCGGAGCFRQHPP